MSEEDYSESSDAWLKADDAQGKLRELRNCVVHLIDVLRSDLVPNVPNTTNTDWHDDLIKIQLELEKL